MVVKCGTMDFDDIVEKYDTWFRTPLGRYVDRWEKDLTWRFARPRQGEKVLDIGTGTANYLMELARMGLDCTGVDVSKKMLKRAREKSRKEGLCLNLVLSGAEELPFSDRHFDLVFSVTAFEFFRSPGKAAEEMVRVCRPGGRVLVSVLNKWSIWTVRRRIMTLFRETIFTECRFYSFRELRRLFGPVEWGTAVFAPPALPKQLIPFFEKAEPGLQRIAKPFGAYLVVCRKL